MSNFSVEDILLLIHGEITTAVTSAEVYGASPGIKLSNVRVRMGQSTQGQEDRSISLDTERFPPAEQGWLIDVIYSPTDNTNQAPITDNNQILPSQLSKFLALSSVEKLSGVGKHYQGLLNHINIQSIQDLAELQSGITALEEIAITPSQLRRFQSLAHLALSVPATSIPADFATITLADFLELLWSKAHDTRLSSLSGEAKGQVLRWLQQLELCLDNDFFNQITLQKMLKEP